MYRLNQIKTVSNDCYSSARLVGSYKGKYYSNAKFTIQNIETKEYMAVDANELYYLGESGLITFTTVYKNNLYCTLSSLKASLLYNSVVLVDCIPFDSLSSMLPDSRRKDYQEFTKLSAGLIKERKAIGCICKYDCLNGLDFTVTSLRKRRLSSSNNGMYLGYRCDGTVVDADTNRVGNDFIADSFNILYNVIDYYLKFPHRFFMYDNKLYIPASRDKLFVFEVKKYFIMEML